MFVVPTVSCEYLIYEVDQRFQNMNVDEQEGSKDWG